MYVRVAMVNRTDYFILYLKIIILCLLNLNVSSFVSLGLFQRKKLIKTRFMSRISFEPRSLKCLKGYSTD